MGYKNKILFIEDIGERGYRVDRMLEQFDQAGLLNSAKALVFGDFIGGEEPGGHDRTGETIQFWSEKLKIPVYSGLPAGHGKVQRPVFFNCKAEIKLMGSKASLSMKSGGKK